MLPPYSYRDRDQVDPLQVNEGLGLGSQTTPTRTLRSRNSAAVGEIEGQRVNLRRSPIGGQNLEACQGRRTSNMYYSGNLSRGFWGARGGCGRAEEECWGMPRSIGSGSEVFIGRREWVDTS